MGIGARVVHEESASVSDWAVAGEILNCTVSTDIIVDITSNSVITWLCLTIGVHPLSLFLNYISTLYLYSLNGKRRKFRFYRLVENFKVQNR